MSTVLTSFAAALIDQIMKAIWAAAMWLLRSAFALMDSIGGFRDGSTLVDATGRPSPAAPYYALWPTLVWIGGAVAVGLFLWQLTLTMIRGGAGFWRVASGPAAYGVATALTLGGVAALVGAAEGLTTLLLQRGLAADNFRTILDHPNLAFSDSPALDSSLDATARAVLLGMIALFGVVPAAIGFLLQMLFRQAVIVVLIATVPITAAGLLANTTASWFWRSMRWMLAAILMKPALALVLVIGVNMLSGPASGIGGLLAGAGVLLISLFCPLVLFRLLAFVETGIGADGSARFGLAPGAGSAGQAQANSYAEQVNVARFDAVEPRGRIAAVAPEGGGAGPHGAIATASRLTRRLAGAPTDAPGAGPGRERPATDTRPSGSRENARGGTAGSRVAKVGRPPLPTAAALAGVPRSGSRSGVPRSGEPRSAGTGPDPAPSTVDGGRSR